jgi:hypothetical protein
MSDPKASWQQLRACVESKLREFEADAALDRLSKLGADRKELCNRLAPLLTHLARVGLQRLSMRKAMTYANSIRVTADLIETLNRRRDRDFLLGEDYRCTLEIPVKLREFADRVRNLPRAVSPRWNPFRVTAISRIIWYVKTTTGGYHDELVSALIGPFVPNENFSTEALKQWRARHREDIRSLGPLDVFPHLLRPPSGR